MRPVLILALLAFPPTSQSTQSTTSIPNGAPVSLSVGGGVVAAVLGQDMVLDTATSPPTLLRATVDASDAYPWIVVGSIGDWGGSTIPAKTCVERSIPAPGAYPNERLATGYPPVLGIALSPSMYTAYGLLVVKLCNVGDVGVQSPNGQTFSAEIMRR